MFAGKDTPLHIVEYDLVTIGSLDNYLTVVCIHFSIYFVYIIYSFVADIYRIMNNYGIM